MKILQVIHDFLPEAIGGTQIYTYGLSKELSKRNNVYLFFSNNNKNSNDFISKSNFDGLPYISINSFAPFNNLPILNFIKPGGYYTGKNKKIARAFFSVIKEIKPDIIHFQHLVGLSMNLINIAHELKIPVIFTAHDYWLICPNAHLIDNNFHVCNRTYNKLKCLKCFWSSGLLKLRAIHIFKLNTYIELPKNIIKVLLNFIRLVYSYIYIVYIRPKAISEIIRNTDLFITPSVRLQAELTRSGIPKNKLKYLDMGIPNNLIKKNQKYFHKNLKFGFIGSDISHKGLQVLLQAYKYIDNSFLDIYGSVSEGNKEKYLNLIKNKNINFKGIFKQDEVKKIFTKIDILVVPSLCMENSPIVVRESFANKTPVIASDIGGLSEMIQDGENGLLFRVGDSEDLFKKMKYFIDNPNELKRMIRGIKRVRTMEEHTIEMESLYKNLIEKHLVINSNKF